MTVKMQVSEQSDPELQKLLTDKNGKESNIDHQSGSGDDIEGNDKLKEKKLKSSFLSFSPIIDNIDEHNISLSEIANIARGKISFTSVRT